MIPTPRLCIIFRYFCVYLSVQSKVWAADPVLIEAITDPDHPLQRVEAVTRSGHQVQRYDLKAPDQWVRRMTQGLPQTETALKHGLEQKLNALGPREVSRLFNEAFLGLGAALKYGVNRYPVLIFDQGVAAVYGVTDVEVGLKLYQDFQRRGGQ